MIPNTARKYLLSGLPGNLSHDGPTRAVPGLLNSDDETANMFGRAFTYQNSEGGLMQAGGTGLLAGVMINPKAYAIENAYAHNGTTAEFLQMGAVYVQLENAGAMGDLVYYDPDDGSLQSAPPADPAPAGMIQIPGAVVSHHKPSVEVPRLAIITLNGPVGGSPAVAP